jgi:pyruvate/2-oxoglutarate/acetoin dehydrogenase E1 component
MAVRDALNSAMDEEMARDDKVLVGGRPRWAAGARRGRGSAGRQREG